MPTKTLADVADDAPIYVTTNRTSQTPCVHLERECRHLRAANNPVIEKDADAYPPDKAVCESCAGNPPGGGTDLSTYMTAKRIGEARHE